MSRSDYDPGMTLPSIDEVLRQHAVTLGDLTVTFVIRLIPAGELSDIMDEATRLTQRDKVQVWEAAKRAHEADPENEPAPGDYPEPGDIDTRLLRPAVLAAGVHSYYSSKDSTSQPFTREDADAIEVNYPRFVRQGLYDSLMTWALTGVESDPFARPSQNGNDGR